ncbi:unnamed protein product [Ilex paraguariensis]|uniref:Uncharacterized protein n=1 Tax=Ilex paraguariensis TaxID=185542 RepID=A0ABC8T979_9AQUA
MSDSRVCRDEHYHLLPVVRMCLKRDLRTQFETNISVGVCSRISALLDYALPLKQMIAHLLVKQGANEGVHETASG